MKETTLVRLACFLSGVSVGIILQMFACRPIGTTQEVEIASTNAIVQVETTTNRATSVQQVDWFKDSSNYIWDGWKIK